MTAKGKTFTIAIAAATFILAFMAQFGFIIWWASQYSSQTAYAFDFANKHKDLPGCVENLEEDFDTLKRDTKDIPVDIGKLKTRQEDIIDGIRNMTRAINELNSDVKQLLRNGRQPRYSDDE